MLYMASDHGGYELKEKIKSVLNESGLEITDLGPHSYVPEDDYPDYVLPVIKKIETDPNAKAILLCKNGVGVSMLANRSEKIRCALSFSSDHAKSSRIDDNTNVLALPAEYLTEEEALEIVKVWLETPFSNAERHQRRLQKVANAHW